MDKISPLDIIVFYSNSIYSKLITEIEHYELGSNDNISHVGIAITKDILPDIPQLQPERIYVLESTYSTNQAPDILTGKGAFGLQIRDLSEIISVYGIDKGSKIGYATLLDNPWYTNPTLVRERLRYILERYGASWYEINPIKLLAAVSPTFRYIRDGLELIYIECHRLLTTIKLLTPSDIDTLNLTEAIKLVQRYYLFCSELASIVYQELGVISKEYNPANIAPVTLLKILPVRDIVYLEPTLIPLANDLL